MMHTKKLVGAMAAAMLMAGCAEQEPAEPEEQTLELETVEQRVNYIFGLNMAENAKNNGLALEPEALALAAEDVRDEKDPRLSEEEIAETMQAFQEQQMQEREVSEREASERNLAEGQAYLEENLKKEGVQETDSGLQYRVLEEGDSEEKPAAEDTVTVHYTGTLIDGEVFDSSVERGEPTSFPLNSVIDGWTEGLQLMSPGDKYELVIPPDLGYGSSTRGPIPPSATLVFEVELLDIERAEEESADGEQTEAEQAESAQDGEE